MSHRSICLSHATQHRRLAILRPDVVPTPHIVFWETTGACNLRCMHCRREWTDTAPNELTSEEAKRYIIDAIADAKWNTIVVFSGGEPLLRSDVFQLLSYSKQRHVACAIATNATLVDATIAQQIARHGVTRVSVSLDGATAQVHNRFRGVDGSFERALQGIKALRLASVQVQINVTFTKRNLFQVSQLLDLVSEFDCCALHAFLLVPVGCGVSLPEDVRLEPAQVEQLLVYLDQQATQKDIEIRATCAPQAQRIRIEQAAKRRAQQLPPGRGLAPSSKGCLAGGAILFANAVGKVFPCGYMPLQVGDLRTHKLTEIPKHSNLLADLRDTSKLQGQCQSCTWASRCGGCRARALGTYNNLFAQDPSCLMNS